MAAPRVPDGPGCPEARPTTDPSPCCRVRGEYREMPGLLLTEAQAARLLGLEPDVCRDVLATLVSTMPVKREMAVMPRTGTWVLAAFVTLAGDGTHASAQPAAAPALSGSWTLLESTGDLPDQAVRAFDGSAVATATIAIEQAGGAVTVRRTTPDPVVVRVMLLQDGDRDATAPRGAVLTARAQWQDRTLAAHGEVTIRQGFLKRRVSYEETWRVAEDERRLTVTLTVKTPLGVKRRTQTFVRGQKQDAARILLAEGPRATR